MAGKRTWLLPLLAALLVLGGAARAAEEAADANASGDKADWEACDPRSVYQILMEQGSDFASGIASVVGPDFKGSVFLPSKTALEVGELVVTLPGTLFDLVYLGSGGLLDLAVQPKFTAANLRNLYQYHTVPALEPHKVEWVQLKDGSKQNGQPKTLDDYEPYSKDGAKLALSDEEKAKYKVVEKQAEDELEWDVASMLGKEEGDKFFVRSTLNYFEYDQAICIDQSKTILHSGARDDPNYWTNKRGMPSIADKDGSKSGAQDGMIADGIKLGGVHTSWKDADGITNMPPVGILKVKVDRSYDPPKVTAVSGDGLPVMMPVKDAIRSCQGGAVYSVDILLLPCPFHTTTFTDDATGGLLMGVIIEAVAIVVLGVVVIILIGLATGLAVRGNFWLYPILFNSVFATILAEVLKGRPVKGLMEGANLFLAAFGGIAGLPPFNNFFAARSFRALQLRAGPLQSLVDLANRVATRWLGFNGIGTIFQSFNGVLG